MTLRRIVDLVELLVLLAAAATVVALFTNAPTGPESTAPGEPVTGEAIYARNCSGCHGPSGQGGGGPALSPERLAERFPTVADQMTVVSNGRGGMPAFGGRLSAEEIDAVVAYTRTELGS